MAETAGKNLDYIDRALLDIVQTDFPVAHRPYAVLAEKLGIAEDEALRRITAMRKSGIIRRLGANFQSGKLGFVSTLCAARVPADKMAQFVDRVNREPGVTHNYERNHAYNIWFTLIAPSVAERDFILAAIAKDTGVEICNFPATRMYKVKVDFPMREI